MQSDLLTGFNSTLKHVSYETDCYEIAYGQNNPVLLQSVGLRMLFSKHSFILIPYIFLSITQGCSSQPQRGIKHIYHGVKL